MKRARKRRPAPPPDRATPGDRLCLIRTAAIAGTIRRLRRKARWSQASLAQRAQLSTSALSRFECGRSEPSLGEAFRIADALGMSGRDLAAAIEDDAQCLERIAAAIENTIEDTIEDAGRATSGRALWSISMLGRLLAEDQAPRDGADSPG